MSAKDDEFTDFISDRLMRGTARKDKYAPMRSEETRKRLAELEAERELKRSIGRDYWEE